MFSGILAAVWGLIIIARTNSAKANYGTSYTLQAVLVAVMGGVKLFIKNYLIRGESMKTCLEGMDKNRESNYSLKICNL